MPSAFSAGFPALTSYILGLLDDADAATAQATLDVSSADGWKADTATWTYASASTFTVSGDRTAVFTKGTRLKFTQTTVKYGVVASSAHAAGTTTVTIIVNTDYVLANAAISATAYSYAADPQGFPTWFNYTTTPSGWAATPTVVFARFKTIANICYLDLRITGTSNATSASATAPVAAEDTADNVGRVVGPMISTDNGVTVTTPARAFITDASTTITFGKDFGGGAWTSSGTKTVTLTGFYAF